MIIYRILNKVNGKSYIGLTTKGLEFRKYCHLRAVKMGGQSLIAKAIRKYGEDKFSFEIIDTAASIKELRDREIFHIKTLNTFVHGGHGYNGTIGGEGRPIDTILQDERMRRSHSAILMHQRPEYKERISATLIGKNKGKPSWCKGKHLSEECRAKISQTLKDRVQPEEINMKRSQTLKGRKQNSEWVRKRIESRMRTLREKKNENSKV